MSLSCPFILTIRHEKGKKCMNEKDTHFYTKEKNLQQYSTELAHKFKKVLYFSYFMKFRSETLYFEIRFI